MNDLVDMKNRTVLVTGAGQGVGREVAIAFAQHGAGAVIVNDFRVSRAEAVANEVSSLGAKAVPTGGDISKLEDVQGLITSSREAVGDIHVLVNNAGNAGPNPTKSMERPFWEQSPDDWAGYLGTNLFGPLNTCRAVVPAMIEQGYGRIVNVISDAARFGEPNRECYSAGKAGVAGFTRSLASSLGRYNITANCVSLAATLTPRNRVKLQDPEALKKLLKHYIIRRPGEPDDAANMILMLASDAASWITGQTVPVNGGYSFAL